jgi:hypothetical protein
MERSRDVVLEVASARFDGTCLNVDLNNPEASLGCVERQLAGQAGKQGPDCKFLLPCGRNYICELV